MYRHRAPPISGSWSRGAARAVDGASLLHGPLRFDSNAETEKSELLDGTCVDATSRHPWVPFLPLIYRTNKLAQWAGCTTSFWDVTGPNPVNGGKRLFTKTCKIILWEIQTGDFLAPTRNTETTGPLHQFCKLVEVMELTVIGKQTLKISLFLHILDTNLRPRR